MPPRKRRRTAEEALEALDAALDAQEQEGPLDEALEAVHEDVHRALVEHHAWTAQHNGRVHVAPQDHEVWSHDYETETEQYEMSESDTF